jgi:hypothetical protein
MRVTHAFGLVLLCAGSAIAQNTSHFDDHEFDDGSFIEPFELAEDQVQNLVRLGKVWGFLKYHHPLVTAGELHWDYELFRALPAVLDAQDREEGSAAILAWSARLGEPAACDPCAEPLGDDVHLRPELDWIRDEEELGSALSEYLAAVHENRHSGGKQFYVDVYPVGSPKFDDEDAYADHQRPDAGYRLLALFRMWNIIEYWFPYRDVIGGDWDGVLAEFVPRLFAAEEPDDYALQTMALIARVYDTHANLWSSIGVRPPRGGYQLPIAVRFVEGRALVTKQATAADGSGPLPMGGLEVGDILLALDGRPVEELVEEWSPLYAASNVPTRMRDIARALTQGGKGSALVKVDRGGEVLELSAKRVSLGLIDMRAALWHDIPGNTMRLLSEDVAYLKLSSVEMEKALEYIEAAEGTRGLVIDIRSYPSAFMVFALGSHLVAEPTQFTCFTKCDLANPGAFQWTPALSLTPQEPRYEGQVVILIDEVSQSSAEYTTMALRAAPGALVVGSTTAGADGNVSRIPLPGGLRSMISGIGVFYPDKTPTQRIGIVPDIEVLPTIAGLRAGRDEVLEVALREILGPEADEMEVQQLARIRVQGEEH